MKIQGSIVRLSLILAIPSLSIAQEKTHNAEIPSYFQALGIRASVDMRAHDSEVVHQFGGTCSAFATAAAMDNRFRQKGLQKNVSERHLWSLYGRFDADYAVEAAAKNYLTEEQYWPISGTRNTNYKDHAAFKITQFQQHQYNMDAALQGLSNGNPLVMAVQVPLGMSKCDAVISGNSGYTRGQHVVAAVGYKLDAKVAGGGYFIVKNSWGKECGDNGYQYYAFGLCKRNDLYCYFIEIKDVESRTM